jgi:hypothetical protein
MGRVARLGVWFSLFLSPAWVLANDGAQASPSLSLPAVPFVAMSPCRLADTRGNGFVGAFGVPSMAPGTPRHFPVVGQCGIPADAEGVSFNFTVVRTMGPGYLVVHPTGTAQPATSNLNYIAGQVVANSSVVEIGTGGEITAVVVGQQTDLIIDINGYYAGKIVSSFNGLSGDVSLLAGSNVTITPSGNTLTLSAASTPGPPGSQGLQGIQGLAGASGSQGVIGPQGPEGPQGSAGASMLRGVWDWETFYLVGEWVTFGASTYTSLVDDNFGNQPDTSPTYWSMLGQMGPPGADGAPGVGGVQGSIGLQGNQGNQGPQGTEGTAGAEGAQGAQGLPGTLMVFLGAWDLDTTYAVDDTVSFGGSSYISLTAANSDNQPDSNPLSWSLIAKAGADGANGAQGIQGSQGITGDTGVDGPQGPQGAAGPGVYQTNHMLNGTTLSVYLSPVASKATAPSAVEVADNLALITSPCTMTNISVFATSPLDSETFASYTLRVGTYFDEVLGTSNLEDQSLVCTIFPLGNSCVSGGSVLVNPGDIFDVRLSISGTLPGLHHAVVVLTCD